MYAFLRNCLKTPAWLTGHSAPSPLCSGPCLHNHSHPSPWIGPAGLRRAVGAGEHEMLLVWLGDPVLPRTAPAFPEAARCERRHSVTQTERVWWLIISREVVVTQGDESR